MSLSMRSCSCAEGKEVCLVLARDFMNLLVKMQSDPEWHSLKSDETFSCSGCTGLIKFAERRNIDAPDAEAEKAAKIAASDHIKRRRSSTKCSMSGALVASMSLTRRAMWVQRAFGGWMS